MQINIFDVDGVFAFIDDFHTQLYKEQQRIRVAKLHEKITSQRNDFLHKLTYRLTHDNQVDSIAVEDLSVKNMMKNHCLAGSIGDASWGKFFEFLTYKCEWYGKNLITIGRFDPSSRLCKCGIVNEKLSLKDRKWTCEKCGSHHDRDVLAAKNIKHFGLLKQNKIGPEESKSTPMESAACGDCEVGIPLIVENFKFPIL